VYTSSEIDKLDLVINQAIYSFKTARLRVEKETIQKEITRLNEEDPEGHNDKISELFTRYMKLDKVIGMLTNNDSLGRVIH
jgi:hypothetical protein